VNADLSFSTVILTDIYYSFFSGFKNKDVAFFHLESKVMIQADLLFNLPATEQVTYFNDTNHSGLIHFYKYSKSKSSPKLPLLGGFDASSWLHPRVLWSMGVDKEYVSLPAFMILNPVFVRF
jgi:hypothetical protein